MSEAIKNARIESTALGIEGHGILTAMVFLDYGGAAQGFGGYGFDYDKDGQTLGKPSCAVFIRKTLAVVGVDNWEDLVGKHVRVKADGGKVHAIGHIIEDRWFCPHDDLDPPAKA